jgi:hypothetical protein
VKLPSVEDLPATSARPKQSEMLRGSVLCHRCCVSHRAALLVFTIILFGTPARSQDPRQRHGSLPDKFDLTAEWSNSLGADVKIKQTGNVVSLTTGKDTQFDGKISGDIFEVWHTLKLSETNKALPPQIREKVAGEQVGIRGTISGDTQIIKGFYLEKTLKWESKDGEYILLAMAEGRKEITLEMKLKIVDLEFGADEAVLLSRFDVRRQMENLELEYDVAGRGLPEYQTRMDRAQQTSDQIEQQRISVAARFQDTADKLRALQNQKPPIPKGLLALANQKSSLEKEIPKLEDRLAKRSAGNPSQDLSPLISELETAKATLERINQLMAERMPPPPDTSAPQAALKRELQQLDDAAFQLEKDKAHADSELAFAEAGLQSAANTRSELFAKLVELGEQLTGLDALVLEITANAGGKRIFTAENKGDFSELKDLKSEIADMRQLLQESNAARQQARSEFLGASYEAVQALERVQHAIWKTAYTKVAIDFAYQMYDVAKAGANGGPVGALAEATKKIAENLTSEVLDYAGFKMSGGVDPNSIEAEFNTQFGANLKEPLSPQQLTQAALTRGIKDSAFRLMKEKFNKGLGARLAGERLCAASGELAHYAELAATGDTLRRLSTKWDIMKKQVDELKTGKYKLAKLGENVLKDASKTVLKAAADAIEREAWIDYFEKDIIARTYYPLYASNTYLYWKIYDQYNDLLKKEADLEEGFNPKCSFRTYYSASFARSATILVNLKVERPRQEGKIVEFKLKLGNIEMSPSGGDTFTTTGAALQAGPSGGVVLQLR